MLVPREVNLKLSQYRNWIHQNIVSPPLWDQLWPLGGVGDNGSLAQVGWNVPETSPLTASATNPLG